MYKRWWIRSFNETFEWSHVVVLAWTHGRGADLGSLCAVYSHSGDGIVLPHAMAVEHHPRDRRDRSCHRWPWPQQATPTQMVTTVASWRCSTDIQELLSDLLRQREGRTTPSEPPTSPARQIARTQPQQQQLDTMNINEPPIRFTGINIYAYLVRPWTDTPRAAGKHRSRLPLRTLWKMSIRKNHLVSTYY